MLFSIGFLSLPFGTGDTAELVLSAQTFRECINSGQFQECSGMQVFGLTPHIISFALLTVFNDINSTINAWALLNFLLYIKMLDIIRNKYKGNNYVLLSTLIFSPLTAYAIYSFTEMSFIVLSFLLLINLKKQNYVWAFILGLIVSAFKEISLLTVLPLSIAIIYSNKKKLRLKDYSVLGAQIIGFLALYLFNFYKYQSFFDSGYGSIPVVDLRMQFSNFLGVWLSPSGGIVGYFWISLLILLYLNLKVMLKQESSKLPILFVLGSIFANWIVLTNWYSPYGWWAWGPRLFMPVLVLAFLTVLISQDKVEVPHKYLAKTIFALFTVISAFSLVGFLIDNDAFRIWVDSTILQTTACPELIRYELNREAYITCFIEMSWTIDSLPVYTFISFFRSLETSIMSFSSFTLPILILLISLITYAFTLIKQNDK
jgi:hypothetical protein